MPSSPFQPSLAQQLLTNVDRLSRMRSPKRSRTTKAASTPGDRSIARAEATKPSPSPLCDCNGDGCEACGFTGVTQHWSAP